MNIKLRGLVAATLAGSMLMGFGTSAMADSTDDILNALIAKGVLTEEEGALLLKGRTGEKEAAATKKESAVSPKFKDGLSFESGDGKFKAQINGRVHADYRFYSGSDDANNATLSTAGNSISSASRPDTFDIRRARLGFKTTFKDYYEGEVVTDLSPTSAKLDVGFLNVAWWKPVQFRFGKFKMPMNLEELTSSNNIDFQERSFVNLLAPGKETGVMVHGVPFTGVTYALAASNGVKDGDKESDVREDGKDVIGRLTANFAEIMGNKNMVLHTGASFSKGDSPEGTIGYKGETETKTGTTFFRAPVLANSGATLAGGTFSGIDRTRVGLEGAVAYGPFKLQSEWMQLNNQFTTQQAVAGAARNYDLDTNNWYAQALWTLSGEAYADNYKNGAFGALKPAKDFNPNNFSGGLWEIGVRYSEFDASDYNADGLDQGNISAGTVDSKITTKAAGFAQADAWTVGLKFLPTANTKFVLNYVMTDYKNVIGGSTGGVILNNTRVNDEKALIMRAQWMF
ncbi:MAG: OprO/OprP family phosphate-selective porin [Methylovulum sp.]|nr:OprO/OprP family phosphate-selective porin [Methylovulum sp.]